MVPLSCKGENLARRGTAESQTACQQTFNCLLLNAVATVRRAPLRFLD
jgi:hypothetical protein